MKYVFLVLEGDEGINHYICETQDIAEKFLKILQEEDQELTYGDSYFHIEKYCLDTING